MAGSRYRDVASPKRTDGLGVALNHAFRPDKGSEEFQSLLRELDRRT